MYPTFMLAAVAALTITLGSASGEPLQAASRSLQNPVSSGHSERALIAGDRMQNIVRGIF